MLADIRRGCEQSVPAAEEWLCSWGVSITSHTGMHFGTRIDTVTYSVMCSCAQGAIYNTRNHLGPSYSSKASGRNRARMPPGKGKPAGRPWMRIKSCHLNGPPTRAAPLTGYQPYFDILSVRMELEDVLAAPSTVQSSSESTATFGRKSNSSGGNDDVNVAILTPINELLEGE